MKKNLQIALKSSTFEKKLLFLAMGISISSYFFFLSFGLTNAYGDSMSHLNIARSIVDNATPGLAQLGGIWLPLMHILMLPTIWNDFMWHTGLSGSLVSMAAYTLAVIYTFKIVLLLTKSRAKSLLGAGILATNINLLYLQSTPMTESLFVCTLLLSVYYLLQWANTNKISHMIFASIAFFLSTLNRYEGWVVGFIAIIITGIISYKKKGRKHAEGRMILFGSITLIGIFMWILWVAAIFDNPLYFINSPYSAKAQSLIQIQQGQVPTAHNVLISFLTVLYSQIHVNGLILVILGFVGVITFTFFHLFQKERRQNILHFLPLYLLFIPFVFLMYALYSGNIVVSVSEFTKPNGLPLDFNIRYAIYTLPALAIFTALIPTKSKALLLAILYCAFINIAILSPILTHTQIATVTDAEKSSVREVTPLASWLHAHYKNGYILTSAAVSNSVIFESGLDMKDFITEGNTVYWNESMQHPSRYAKFIIISTFKNDSVSKKINKTLLNSQFTVVKSFGTFEVLQKI